MRIFIDDIIYDVELYDTVAGRSLGKQLPQEINMARWGDEYYGSLSTRVHHHGDSLRDEYEPGEVAWWPEGNAFCIFFGPTPASRGNEPRMASMGAPLGKIKGDFSDLHNMGPSLKSVRITPK